MRTNFLLCLLLTILVSIDQITKYAITSYIAQDVDILPFFNLVNITNKGVSFGMFRGWEYSKIFFSSLAVIAGITMMVIAIKHKDKYNKISFCLIAAGAFGNAIDRIIFGGVIDFLDFHIGTHHYPAFNIADSLIFTGAIMLVLEGWFKKILHSNV